MTEIYRRTANYKPPARLSQVPVTYSKRATYRSPGSSGQVIDMVLNQKTGVWEKSQRLNEYAKKNWRNLARVARLARALGRMHPLGRLLDWATTALDIYNSLDPHTRQQLSKSAPWLQYIGAGWTNFQCSQLGRPSQLHGLTCGNRYVNPGGSPTINSSTIGFWTNEFKDNLNRPTGLYMGRMTRTRGISIAAPFQVAPNTKVNYGSMPVFGPLMNQIPWLSPVPAPAVPANIPYFAVPAFERAQMHSIMKLFPDFYYAPPPPPPTKTNSHSRTPPGRGTKERKGKAPKWFNAVANTAWAATEAFDLAEALFDALPEHIQATVPKNGTVDQRGFNPGMKYATPVDKALHVYRHINQLDIDQALKNVIVNHFVDELVGRVAGGAGKQARRIGLTGYGFVI